MRASWRSEVGGRKGEAPKFAMSKDKNKTKFAFLVGDGMADYPLPELDGKTPLEVAKTPNMDRIAACRIGLARTIPEGQEPGSDVANLSLLGYDPRKYNTGRGPLEAASIGVEMGPGDVAFRMNLVTLDWKTDQKIFMVSHSSGEITTDEARPIVESVKRELVIPGVRIYTGVAYRHLLLWKNGIENAQTIPPHDMLTKDVASYLVPSPGNPVPGLTRRSWEILKEHPVNMERRRAGLNEANSIWLWGQGRAPQLPLFADRFGLSGGVISAVDLIKGIGVYAGFTPIHVDGITGYLDTNFRGKARAAVKGLEKLDFVFLHVEAPDEASHSGNTREKILAIEYFDEKVVGTVLQGLRGFSDYRIIVTSDHLTPLVKRTHTAEPAPFAWAGKKELESAPKGPGFTEESARASGLLFGNGYDLMPAFLSNS